jgi:hypothetical protein
MGCQWPIGRGVLKLESRAGLAWDGEGIWSGYGPAHLVGKPRQCCMAPGTKARVSVQGLAQEQATACRGQNRGDKGNSL